MTILTQRQVDSIMSELGTKADCDAYKTAFGRQYFDTLLRNNPEFIDSLNAFRGLSYECVMRHNVMDKYSHDIGNDIINMLRYAANEEELDLLIKKCAHKMRNWGLKNYQIEYSSRIFVSIFRHDLKKIENSKDIVTFLEYMSQKIASRV